MRHIRNRYFFLGDIVLLGLAAYASYVLRLERFDLGSYHWAGFFVFALAGMVVTPLIFYRLGLYSRYWRYASIEELSLLAMAMAASALAAWMITASVALGFPSLEVHIARSVPFLFVLLGLLATAGPRFGARLYFHYYRTRRGRPESRAGEPLRVVIMGAGDAGVMILRELQTNPQIGLEVVGFLDDDPGKTGARIHGVRVLGDRNKIGELAAQRKIDQVIIAMPTVPGKIIRDIVQLCDAAGVRTKIIPGVYELLDGRVSVKQLRDVAIEDLLRRAPVRTDTTLVGALVRGRRVLITGGGGSIGRELCRQVLHWQPAELVVVGHGENSVFESAQELQAAAAGAGNHTSQLRTVIADIRFPDRIRAVFAVYRPEIVFHTAAHKHVPLMELNPAEAVTNNVYGTQNVLAAAAAAGVEHLIMISTDKAVNPTSMMGATKRVAELLVHRAARQTGKSYVTVRFGNVLGSRGSVVLTFRQQIAAGGPVTVTHPDMVRYFMTIPEAVQLVLQAAVLGHGGELFVLDMGEPVRIVDLARDLIDLSGLKVGQDIDIVFTGARPGEKICEELFLSGEDYRRTAHEKIYTARHPGYTGERDLDQALEALYAAAARDDRPAILAALQDLVPEFRPEATGIPAAGPALQAEAIEREGRPPS